MAAHLEIGKAASADADPRSFSRLCDILRDDEMREKACGRPRQLAMDSRTHDLYLDGQPFGLDTGHFSIRTSRRSYVRRIGKAATTSAGRT